MAICKEKSRKEKIAQDLVALRKYYYVWGNKVFGIRVVQALFLVAYKKKMNFVDHKADILRKDFNEQKNKVYKRFWKALRDKMNPGG